MRARQWTALAGFLMAATGAAAQVIVVWSGGPDSTPDGAWLNPFNWTLEAHPGSLDTAHFNLSQTYSVGVDEQVYAGNVHVTAGNLAFNVGNNSELHIAKVLKVHGATLRVEGGPVTATQADLRNATIQIAGGHLKIAGANEENMVELTNFDRDDVGILRITGHGVFEGNLDLINPDQPSITSGSLIRADGGDLRVILSPEGNISGSNVSGSFFRDYGTRGWAGGLDTQQFKITLETGGRIMEVGGPVHLGGGILKTPDWGLTLAGAVTGHGTIEGSNRIDILNSLALDGDLAINALPYILVQPSHVEFGSYASYNGGSGIEPAKNLMIGSHTLTITGDGATVVRGNTIELAGGTIASRSGWTLARWNQDDATITGFGFIRGKLTMDGSMSLLENPLVATGSIDHITSENIGAGGLTVLSATPVAIDGAVTMAGGELRSDHGWTMGTAGSISGHGVVHGALPGLQNVTITGELAPQYFGGGPVPTYWLSSTPTVMLGARNAIHDDWMLWAPGGIDLGGAEIYGHGELRGPISGAGIIRANGDLRLGEATHTAGFDFDGTLDIDTHHVVLRSASAAGLGSLTMLMGGVLESATGFTLDNGEQVTGGGLLLGAIGGSAGGSGLSPNHSFSYHDALALGNGEAWILSDAGASFSSAVTLAGGTIHGPGESFDLTNTGAFSGYGTLQLHLRALGTASVAVSGGTLNLMQGGVFAGTLAGTAGSTLHLGGGLSQFNNGLTGSLPLLSITGGSASVQAGSGLVATNIAVSGGTLSYAVGSTSVSSATSLEVSGAGAVWLNITGSLDLPASTRVAGDGITAGTLTGIGSGNWQLGAGGTLALDRGKLLGSGTLTIANGALLDVTASNATLGRNVTNQGTVRLNVADVTYSPLAGAATITNQAGATLRLLDAPLDPSGYNPNGIFASGLNVTNAGTVTVGALTAQTGNLGLTLFSTEGAFSNSGTVSLTNSSELRLLGGGTQTGTFALGGTGSHLLFAGNHVINAGASTFSGEGTVHISGGTLHTAAGVYTPNYHLAFTGLAPAMPEATGLNITESLLIAGGMPDVPVTIQSGGVVTWSHGVSENTFTVNSGGALRFAGATPYLLEDLPTDLTPDGDIINHGMVQVFSSFSGDPIEGAGILRNRSDGTVTNYISPDTPSQVARFLLDLVNEGLVDLRLRESGLLEWGAINNSGQVAFRATELNGDLADDLKIKVGNYTQTAGATTIETTLWNSGELPDARIEFGSFNLLGGSVTATGRLLTTGLTNQSVFNVGSGGLIVNGNFTNAVGGELRLAGHYTQATGALALQSGSKLTLDGAAANLTVNGNPLFSGNYTTPAGVTLEIRNRAPSTNQTFTTDGTYVIGQGAVHSQWGGNLDGLGTVRVGNGGTLWLGFSGNYSADTPLLVDAGGLVQIDGHVNDINRFYGRPFTNNGTVEHNASHLGMSATTLFTNNGLWIERSGKSFTSSDNQAGGGVFANNGTFRKTGANQATFAGSVVFNNTGLVDLQEGSILVAGAATLAGSSVVNMAAGTSFLIRDGEATINSGARFNGGELGFGDGGDTTLSGDIHATHATFWGGALYGTHTLHGSWFMGYGSSFGTTGTTTIASDGTWEFGGHNNGINRLYGRTFVNEGTVNHMASHIGMSASTTITNNSLWVDGSGMAFTASENQPGGGVFVNNGTFRKTGGNETGFGGSVVFNNTGLIDIQQGGIGIYGTATLAGSTVVNMAAGTYVLIRDGAATIHSGARFNGGALSLGDAGDTTLLGDIYATNASFWGGALYGSHTLHGSWSMGYGAYFGTTGTTTIANDGTWEFGGHNNGINRIYDRTFVNNGTVNHVASHIGMNAGTTITNNSLWVDGSGAAFTASDNQAGGGTFVNNGTFRKTGANQVGFGGSMNLVNNGVIDLQQGSIGVYGNATFAGSTVVNMAAGTYLLIRDGAATINSGARFNGDLSLGDAGATTLTGDVHATNASFWGGALYGTHTLHGNWWTGAGAWFATPGTTTIASDGVLQFDWHNNGINRIYDRSIVNNGTIKHTGSHLGMNVNSTITNNGLWEDSSSRAITVSDNQVGGGAFINNGTFRKTGANEVQLGGVRFTNHGTVDVQEGILQLFDTNTGHVGATLTGGTWIIRNGAELREWNTTSFSTNQASLTLHGTGWFYGLEYLNRNEGTFRLLDGRTFTPVAVPFTNTGALEVGAGSGFSTTSIFTNSGTLNVSGAFTSAGLANTGTLAGNGTFTGNVLSSGILAPGNSPGLLTFTGNLTLQATSDLLMELGGLGEGISYDSLEVGGTLTLGGDLVVSLLNSFAPATGATFNLFDAATLTGTFSSLTLPTLTSGLSWNTSALYTTGVLSVTGTAVPEPSTYALGLGLAGLVWACWRRRRVAAA